MHLRLLISRGFAGHFLRPFTSLMWSKISAVFSSESPPSSHPAAPKVDGAFIERLKSWSKSFAIGGIETNVALAK